MQHVDWCVMCAEILWQSAGVLCWLADQCCLLQSALQPGAKKCHRGTEPGSPRGKQKVGLQSLLSRYLCIMCMFSNSRTLSFCVYLMHMSLDDLIFIKCLSPLVVSLWHLHASHNWAVILWLCPLGSSAVAFPFQRSLRAAGSWTSAAALAGTVLPSVDSLDRADMWQGLIWQRSWWFTHACTHTHTHLTFDFCTFCWFNFAFL